MRYAKRCHILEKELKAKIKARVFIFGCHKVVRG
jgi:hypothetical protein